MLRCDKCGQRYGESLSLMGGSVKVASCQVCPVDRIFAVCERCADIEATKRSSCPGCGARGMWRVQGMDPA
jgi:hypothetical protein